MTRHGILRYVQQLAIRIRSIRLTVEEKDDGFGSVIYNHQPRHRALLTHLRFTGTRLRFKSFSQQKREQDIWKHRFSFI